MTGLVTVSEKKKRNYVRAFDHEEAKRLRAEGWSGSKLAEHFGVSETAIYRVVDERQRRRMQEQSDRWVRKNRKPCKGGCGALVWMHGSAKRTRSGYCSGCFAKSRATSVRPDALRCSRCGEWKADEAFPHAKGAKARRGRHSLCRPCNTIKRREHRQKRPELQKLNDMRATEKRREKSKVARFIVFQPNGRGFVEIERVDAVSSNQAIEKVATEPGDYVAVTEGRFRVVRVEPIQALRVVNPVTGAA